MPRATWTGSISLGMLNVPIKMYVDAREDKVSFSTIEKATGERIRMPYVSSVTGDELDRKADVMKRYEFGDGSTVDVTADEIALVQPLKTSHIELVGFVPKHEIDPSLYTSAHQVGPGEGGELGLTLLARVLEDRGLVGVGSYVKAGHERLVVLRATTTRVYVHELYWFDEVREPAVQSWPEPTDQMLEMADDMVMGMTIEWEHASFENTHRDALLSMLARKLEGKEPVVEEVEAESSPGDLMAQLEAQIAQAKGAA